MAYRESRLENEKQRRKKIKMTAIVILVVLLAGVGLGVGLNFLLSEPKAERIEEEPEEEIEEEATSEEEGEAEEEEPDADVEEPEFDASAAMSDIYEISKQIGARPAGSGQESETANHIAQQLAESGYEVEEQVFTTSEGFKASNIVATKRGSREGYTIIIGAHYDSGSGSEGAVDNASGVGVVLELARVFSERRPEPTLKFVFFGANRPGVSSTKNRLLGSRHFVDMIGSMEKREIVGMIAVDSVAQGEYLLLRTQETGLQRLRDKMAVYAQEMGLPASKLKSADESDNIPFEDVQIPAVWVEWCESGGKLVTDDTYSSVSAEKVNLAGELIESFLLNLTFDDLKELKY